jgi:hypothetical protein
MKLMAQVEAQIPHPLTDPLPALLPGSRMTTPTVGVLFQIFIGEHRFKSAPMQIQRHHISSRESSLWQRCKEQFVDESLTRGAHRTLCRSRSRMGSDHDPTPLSRGADDETRTIVEQTRGAAFRMARLLIGRKLEAGLDLSSIKDLIVFAPHHIG